MVVPVSTSRLTESVRDLGIASAHSEHLPLATTWV